MSIFKKYKLWWLICAAVFWFMTANAIAFALIGLSLITPSNLWQGAVSFFTLFLSGFFAGVGSFDNNHLKG